MKIIEKIKENEVWKPDETGIVKCTKNEINFIYESIALLSERSERYPKVVYRGTKKKIIEKNLKQKLNSNNSLYDGIFLIGEKAKNYLLKPDEIPHPVKDIDERSEDFGTWLFEELHKSKIIFDQSDFFDIPTNMEIFTRLNKENKKVESYYLSLLHRVNSDHLVNYVSATEEYLIAESNSNDLIFVIILTESYSQHTISFNDSAITDLVVKMKLPYANPLHVQEKEISFKGFILPHFIAFVFDKKLDKCIVNPAFLYQTDNNWIHNGFEINQENFDDFIKTTRYKRFLTLHDNLYFKENQINNNEEQNNK